MLEFRNNRCIKSYISFSGPSLRIIGSKIINRNDRNDLTQSRFLLHYLIQNFGDDDLKDWSSDAKKG